MTLCEFADSPESRGKIRVGRLSVEVDPVRPVRCRYPGAASLNPVRIACWYGSVMWDSGTA